MEKAELLRSSGRARLLRGSGTLSRSGRLKEVDNMGVEKVGEKYRCNVCGNEVKVTTAGGGTLVCCGEDMELIE
jgi:desulfoferrodoxin-like iron-binding protein